MTRMIILSLSVGLFARTADAGTIRAEVLDVKNKAAVKDAIVFVYTIPGGKFKPHKKPAVIDQINKQFAPPYRAVLVGTKVVFPNKDNIHHHLYSFSKAKKFERALYKGENADPVIMDKPGLVKMGCNIHDWMVGYVLVSDNPYFAETDSEGVAVIEGVPAGKRKVAVWSPRLRGSVDATLQETVVGKEQAALTFKPDLKTARKKRKKQVSDY